jgi:beta-lactamase class D
MLDLQEYFNILVSRISGPNWTVHGESGVLHNKGWIIYFQSCLEQEIYYAQNTWSSQDLDRIQHLVHIL